MGVVRSIGDRASLYGSGSRRNHHLGESLCWSRPFLSDGVTEFGREEAAGTDPVYACRAMAYEEPTDAGGGSLSRVRTAGTAKMCLTFSAAAVPTLDKFRAGVA